MGRPFDARSTAWGPASTGDLEVRSGEGDDGRMIRVPLVAVVCSLLVSASARTQVPEATADDLAPFDGDWLVHDVDRGARAYTRADGKELVLTNGIVQRVWRLTPTAACVALDELRTGRSLLRAVRPEARVVIDGESHDIGGLVGQPNHAYLLPRWVDQMKAPESAFRFVGFEVGKPVERLRWKRVRHHAPGATWPPKGIRLRLDFTGAPRDPGRDRSSGRVKISVHYELYDGVPVFVKWITIENDTSAAIEVDRLTPEILAVVEHSNPVEYREGVPLPIPTSLHVETDYAMGGFSHRNANRWVVHWRPDPQFGTQVNWAKKMPCLLEVEPTRGPHVLVNPGDRLDSFRVFELVQDSDDRERRALALRRMYRIVAPWVTENPLILHVVTVDGTIVRRAIDQAAECGFEMVSLSFGSGLNMENDHPDNHARFRRLADHAKEKGIHLGGYSLLSSRRIGPETDVKSPPGEKPTHGACPALTSEWGQAYLRKLRRFFDQTGFLQFTHDGSYPGDFDVTPRPPLQRGLDDSQWAQWRAITATYRWMRARGVYLRIPDYYFLQGGNECGMGYREVNWSLPRAQQVIHTRQNIYDGTWEKTPSMGWMFVPLTQYHGGGAAATIEPLDRHIDHYRRMIDSNLSFGVQAVYRGHRLYDTPRVRDMVKERVAWFKRHRDILESDLIHGRRADGRDVDWMLHVNPRLAEKGMLVVHNPLPDEVVKTLRVNVYYTGLHERLRAVGPDGESRVLEVERDFTVRIPVRVPGGGMAAYVFRDAD